MTVEENAGMVGPRVASQRNRDIFPNKPDRPDAGLVTFAWPVFPICKQKLVEVNLFDPQAELFGHGAHMPLMVFVGDKSRRTPQAWRRRERNADYRGWTADRRHPERALNRGGGGNGQAGRGRGH